MRVGVPCINTVVPFSDRIDATFEGGRKCIQSHNSLNFNNHKWRLANLILALPEEEKEGCCDSEILFGRLSAVKLQMNSFVPILLLQFFNYSHLLLVQKKPLLMCSSTCKSPYSDINSKDFTWCLNIFSLLECKLYFGYWKIRSPSESR